MSAEVNRLLQTFKDAVQEQINKSSDNGYDVTATVRRVEGDTAYVHIEGGYDETPVQRTIACQAGDNVEIRVSNGRGFIVGNGSAPPTDDRTANQARAVADEAQDTATTALSSATRAQTAAESAEASAETAQTAATQAVADAAAARTAAGNAQTSANAAQASADNANEYAARALGNLASVQSVTETLNWITSHGTMTLTSDTALDPTHVYFVVDASGDYTVGGTTYSVVTDPDVADIATYYELSIDESLNNYVATHLAVDSEGLWIIPDSTNGNRVLIATGSGTTYTTAGTYIVGTGGVVLAEFTASGVRVGQESSTKRNMEITNEQVAIKQNQIIKAAMGGGQAILTGEELTDAELNIVLELALAPQTYSIYTVNMFSRYIQDYFAGLELNWELRDSYESVLETGTFEVPDDTGDTLWTVLYDDDGSSEYANAETFCLVNVIDNLVTYYAEFGVEITYDDETYEDYNEIVMTIPTTGQSEEQFTYTIPLSGIMHDDSFRVTWDGDVWGERNIKAGGEVIDGNGNKLSDAKVTDVEVNGTSVVTDGVANVTVPTKTSDLTNDSGFVDSGSLAAVATSGDYSDLSNTPSLAAVATSGSYTDLSDTPTLSPMFKTVTVTASSATSISANSYKNIAMAPAAQSGYTRVGLVGWNTGSTHVFIATCTGTTITFCNKSSSAQSITPSAVWLFIRSTF